MYIFTLSCIFNWTGIRVWYIYRERERKRDREFGYLLYLTQGRRQELKCELCLSLREIRNWDFYFAWANNGDVRNWNTTYILLTCRQVRCQKLWCQSYVNKVDVRFWGHGILLTFESGSCPRCEAGDIGIQTTYSLLSANEIVSLLRQ